MVEKGEGISVEGGPELSVEECEEVLRQAADEVAITTRRPDGVCRCRISPLGSRLAQDCPHHGCTCPNPRHPQPECRFHGRPNPVKHPVR